MEANKEKDNNGNHRLCIILYISGLLDFLGVSMILPLLSPYARDLGLSPTLVGLLGSVYGCVQLLSSPIVGKWSDMVTRQYSLFICLLLSSFGYVSLGIFASLISLFFSRFFLGCFKHSQTISKAYLSDFVSKERLPAELGKFNSYSSIGFVIGPVIGGHLADSSGGFMAVTLVTGLIFVINAALIWWTIPMTNLPTNEKQENSLQKNDSLASFNKLYSDELDFSFKKLTASFREIDWDELWDLFLIKFLAGFSILVFRTNFSLVLKDKYKADQKTIGYLTSYSGVVATIAGFLMYIIINRYKSTAQLFFHTTILQVLTLVSLLLSSSITLLVVFLAPLSVITSISRVTSTAVTLTRSRHSNSGSIMGLNQSILAVARMLAPFTAGVAQEFSVDGATYISILASSASAFLMWWRPQCPELRIRNKKTQ